MSSNLFFGLNNLFSTFILNKSALIYDEFYKDCVVKGSFLKNSLVYYDFFFITVSFINEKFFIQKLNLIYINNFKNFIDYFYNASVLGENFLVIDNNNSLYTPFVNLMFSEFVLLKYSGFFSRGSFFFNQQFELLELKKFLKNNKITTLFVLNYDNLYKYLTWYTSSNAVLFSFVLPNTRVSILDFFLFKSNEFFFLERLFFLSKIYSVYNIGYTDRVNIFKLKFILKSSRIKDFLLKPIHTTPTT